MRLLLSTLVTLILGSALIVSSARAQNHPWCAVLDMGDLAFNCGFATEEQCRNSVRGIGGFCVPNNTYRPPGGGYSSRRLHRPYR